MAECNPADHIFDMLIFGFFSAQEFASCRRIVKQISHVDCRAIRMGNRVYGDLHVTTFTVSLPCLFLIFRSGSQSKPADGTDTGQCFTAEP